MSSLFLLLLLSILLLSCAPFFAVAMNKSELIDAVAKDANLSKADSKRALEVFVHCASDHLLDEGTTSLPGFGTFFLSRFSKKGTITTKPRPTTRD